MNKPDGPDDAVNPRTPGSLREIALLFLKLGATAFGGPAVHVAMMHEEVVNRRRWISREEFLDLVGAANLIPGPNSTELAIHLGHRRGGWPGLLVAGACFILPAAFVSAAFAWAYVRYGTLPEAGAVLYGIKPAIIAIVLHALWELGRTAIKTPILAMISIIGVALGLAGFNEILILLTAALAYGLGRAAWNLASRSSLTAIGLPLLLALPAGAAAGAKAVSLSALFLFFAKVGSVLFGSGYVLLAFLRADLVDRWHWLTEAQLLDAIAIGQMTPGPVFTTATFIGYFLAGPMGAVVATVGIFLPAFVFVAASRPIVPRIRGSLVAGAMLDGVNAASLSLMAIVTYQLGRAAIFNLWSGAIALISAFVVLRYRPNPVAVVLGGAATGLILRAMGLGGVS